MYQVLWTGFEPATTLVCCRFSDGAPSALPLELPEKSDTAQWPSGRPSSSTAVPLTPAHGGGQVFLFLRLVLNQWPPPYEGGALAN